MKIIDCLLLKIYFNFSLKKTSSNVDSKNFSILFSLKRRNSIARLMNLTKEMPLSPVLGTMQSLFSTNNLRTSLKLKASFSICL